MKLGAYHLVKRRPHPAAPEHVPGRLPNLQGEADVRGHEVRPLWDQASRAQEGEVTRWRRRLWTT